MPGTPAGGSGRCRIASGLKTSPRRVRNCGPRTTRRRWLPEKRKPETRNFSRFLGDGCLEAGAPRLYDDLRKLNDGLRERGRDALVAYLGGVNGIKKTPKELSDQLLLDVETGCSRRPAGSKRRSPPSRRSFSAAVSVWSWRRSGTLHPSLRTCGDFRFASYHVWQACKRRELYKENWIDWHELEKATKIESFRFMDEELRRVSLTIAAPGGVDYWPEHRPPAPGLCLLQERDPATMQPLSAPARRTRPARDARTGRTSLVDHDCTPADGCGKPERGGRPNNPGDPADERRPATP